MEAPKAAVAGVRNSRLEQLMTGKFCPAALGMLSTTPKLIKFVKATGRLASSRAHLPHKRAQARGLRTTKSDAKNCENLPPSLEVINQADDGQSYNTDAFKMHYVACAHQYLRIRIPSDIHELVASPIPVIFFLLHRSARTSFILYFDKWLQIHLSPMDRQLTSLTQQSTPSTVTSAAFSACSTSEDGRLLATGGIDGTKIWCLQAMQLLHEIPSFGIRGPLLRFAGFDETITPKSSFLHTAHSATVFTEFHVAQITILVKSQASLSSSSNRVAMVNVKGSVVTMSIDPVTMQPSLHGGCHVLHNSNGALMKTQNLGTTIGKVSSDPVKNLFCTDTMTEGLTLHRMSDAAQVGSFPIPKDRIKIAAPIGVTFGEGCKIVVAGSDHGLLYIFDLRTGSLLERLTVTEGAWIQAVRPIVRQFSFRKVLDTLAIAVVAAAALTAVYQNWGFFQQGWKQDGIWCGVESFTYMITWLAQVRRKHSKHASVAISPEHPPRVVSKDMVVSKWGRWLALLSLARDCNLELLNGTAPPQKNARSFVVRQSVLSLTT
ncbi:hypothetical protein BDZ89DRAFT_1054072 [Hymenopellis radicata]|nr:hypothetical protein BDZ89DRAFT_1054072 [Hymenopellis radicata]